MNPRDELLDRTIPCSAWIDEAAADRAMAEFTALLRAAGPG